MEVRRGGEGVWRRLLEKHGEALQGERGKARALIPTVVRRRLVIALKDRWWDADATIFLLDDGGEERKSFLVP